MLCILCFNPFTATGRIYTLQKRPCWWPRTYIFVQPQFRFHAFAKALPPMWLWLHVSEVSSSSVRWSLLALLGLVHWENSSSMLRAVFIQMAGNSVVDVPRCHPSWHELYVWWLSSRWRSRRQHVSSCWKWGRREWRWRLDWLGEETGDGGSWWKRMTTLLAAVNENLSVQTHNERWSSSRDRRYECTSIIASETLRVSCQETQRI